jgi:hypothetical protein
MYFLELKSNFGGKVSVAFQFVVRRAHHQYQQIRLLHHLAHSILLLLPLVVAGIVAVVEEGPELRQRRTEWIFCH